MTREQLELASVEQVQELQSALRSANVRLEQRVADRTRELEQAYRKLTELDQLKGNFISNVSHELRTPLTKIKGFNALLAAGDLGALTAEQQQAVEVMGRGVSELERLVGDLIQFATGARGEMVLRPAVMPVAETLEQRGGRAARPCRGGGRDADVSSARARGLADGGPGEGALGARSAPRQRDQVHAGRRARRRRRRAFGRPGPHLGGGYRGWGSPRTACRNCSSPSTSSTGRRRAVAGAPGSASPS